MYIARFICITCFLFDQHKMSDSNSCSRSIFYLVKKRWWNPEISSSPATGSMRLTSPSSSSAANHRPHIKKYLLKMLNVDKYEFWGFFKVFIHLKLKWATPGERKKIEVYSFLPKPSVHSHSVLLLIEISFSNWKKSRLYYYLFLAAISSTMILSRNQLALTPGLLLSCQTLKKLRFPRVPSQDMTMWRTVPRLNS